jgi:hypothetical protein
VDEKDLKEWYGRFQSFLTTNMGDMATAFSTGLLIGVKYV